MSVVYSDLNLYGDNTSVNAHVLCKDRITPLEKFREMSFSERGQGLNQLRRSQTVQMAHLAGSCQNWCFWHYEWPLP